MFVGEEELNKLIEGRVEPHIYAFSTNTIPRYTKIGDTYRSVNTRLNEWKEYFPNLEKEYEKSARIEDVFFRDYAVHRYLENELQKQRLKKEDISDDIYYSKEFFKNIEVDDIDKAINDIKNDYDNNTLKYSFYNVDTLASIETHYERGPVWDLRDNQKEAVKNFLRAKEQGRTNLLMYAVMRFGKSFTSLCCAEKIENLKLVVVVSAKADVKEEWKKNTEIPGNFINFEFKTSEDLISNENLISNHLNNSNGKVIVLFLTLQDLMGNIVKEKHKELFADETNIDMLIIDETHFGARADKYGAVLKQPRKAINKYDNDEIKDITDYSEEINKTLKSRYKLHLSGTPYRILMGSEFQKEDIISFCQYSDIIDEQEKWDKNNLLKDVDENEKPIKEWDNPYYGFPQMIRFAFNPNQSSRERLEEFRKKGYSFALSRLLEPQSTVKDTEENKHKLFVYEKEVLELLEVIDGVKQDNEILSFIDYDKIKQGNMCRHIVMVLPYCASCDAMENLIKTNIDKFKNLQEYEIINISGIDNVNKYKSTNSVKKAIFNCEKENKKTITLTVNRMLTGSTVEQWDTMIYLKDTASPQEYDQAIFRLQSQYIKTYKDGVTGDTIKYNMKPQTLLVDFCIDRIFKMQELKSQIYNVNIDEAGNKKLKQRIERELKISPIIVINKDRIEQVTATNILDAVSNYSKNRGVAEETNDIPVDLDLKEISEIWDVISKENELGSKNGFNIEAVEGDGDEIDTSEISSQNDDNSENSSQDVSKENQSNDTQNIKEKDPVKQFRMYYARILYYSFLTVSKVSSIDDIISSLDDENNSRIFKNMGLNRNVLTLLRDNMNKFMLSSLDYKIQNINNLSNDTSIEPLQRALTANQRFGKLGESEVVTPEKITTDMVELLPEEFIRNSIENKVPILDIASKEAEFAIALYKRFKSLGYDLNDFKDLIYSIPTSNITYEFTRKIYEILGLDYENIALNFNSYDLLKVKSGNEIDYEKIKLLLEQNKDFYEISLEDEVQVGGDEKMVKFGAVVGNPPYQLKGGSGGNNDAPIYQYFSNISDVLKGEFLTLIIPVRWFSAGRENLLGDFRRNMLTSAQLSKMFVYTNASDIFPQVEIKGGICYYLLDSNGVQDCEYTLAQNGRSETMKRKLNDFDILIRDPKIANVVKKVTEQNCDGNTVDKIISADTPFGISSNPRTSKKNKITVYNEIGKKHDTLLFHIEKNVRKVEYVNKNDISKNVQDIDKYKVYIPGGYGAGESFPHQILGVPEYAPKNSVCSQSYLYAAFESQIEAQNYIKYLKTKFFRSLVLAIKITQSAPNKVYRFVPMQDFTDESDIDWAKSISEIDKQLYEKYNLSEDEIVYIESMIKPME